MASASKGWLKYRVGLGGAETGLASQAARRVSPGYFRLALAGSQRYDVIGNFPVRPARLRSFAGRWHISYRRPH